jgi:hypothetical protein
MDLIRTYKRLIPKRWRRPSKHDPTSVVMLLRTPHSFSKEELQGAAERAWHAKFNRDDTDSKRLIVQQGFVTLVKAGPHVLNVIQQNRPYGGEGGGPPQDADWLPRADQKQAWLQHAAWSGIDYMGRKVDLELAYCVLFKIVAELLGGNCTGIYVPGESMLMPNNASLYSILRKVGGSRDAGVNR